MNTRFIRRGVTKFIFIPGVTDLSNITRADLTAGVDFTAEVADVAGWSLENQAAATPDMASTFEKKIPGLDSSADSSITLYEPKNTVPVGSFDPDQVFAKDASGVIVILRRGDVPGSPSMDAYKVIVASNSAQITLGNDPARKQVQFTITDEPQLDQDVPAAA